MASNKSSQFTNPGECKHRLADYSPVNAFWVGPYLSGWSVANSKEL